MKIYYFLFLFLFSPSAVRAQLIGTIQADRPGQAMAASVVAPGVFQLQSGFDIQTFSQSGFKRTNRTSDNVLRLGLAERFEISTLFDISSDTAKTATLEQSFNGVSEWQLGFRYALIEENKSWTPALALQTRFRMKGVSNAYRRNDVAPVFTLSASKSIDQEWSGTVVWGPSWDGFSSTPTYNWVLNVAKSLNSKWSTVGEFYGSESNGVGQTFYGAGFAYLLNDNLQLDAYLSAGKNRGIDVFYGTIGVSWRHLAFDHKAIFGDT